MIARGQLWWADPGLPRGSAPALRRQVLVVSADQYNRSTLQTVTIVVLTGTSRLAALPANCKAGELAHALGAPVHVVCVPSALEAHEWPSRITAQQVVAAAADRLQSKGITVQTHLPKGEAALSLVAVAEAENAQIIVMGNKGMTGIRRLLGSLPNRVSHQASCDVLIVSTQSPSLPDHGGRSIVVGADGEATRAVKEASRLSKALGRELHIVSLSRASDSSEAALAAAVAQATDQGVEAVTHSLDGDPADALLDVAERNEAAIIVLGSKGMRAGPEMRGRPPKT